MELYYHDVDRDVLILNADGGLSAENADEFVAALEEIIRAGARKVIVDCTRLRFISSYGLGVLVRLHEKLSQEGGDVKLASVGSRIVRLLETTRLHRMFHIYPSVEDALAAFRSDTPSS